MSTLPLDDPPMHVLNNPVAVTTTTSIFAVTFGSGRCSSSSVSRTTATPITHCPGHHIVRRGQKIRDREAGNAITEVKRVTIWDESNEKSRQQTFWNLNGDWLIAISWLRENMLAWSSDVYHDLPSIEAQGRAKSWTRYRGFAWPRWVIEEQ